LPGASLFFFTLSQFITKSDGVDRIIDFDYTHFSGTGGGSKITGRSLAV